jgi:hypothetical protein
VQVTVLIRSNWSDRITDVEVFPSLDGACVRARELLAEHGDTYEPLGGDPCWLFFEGNATGQLTIVTCNVHEED